LRAGAVVWEKRYALNAQNLAEAQYRVASNITQEFSRKKEVQNPAATVNYQTYQAYLLARIISANKQRRISKGLVLFLCGLWTPV